MSVTQATDGIDTIDEAVYVTRDSYEERSLDSPPSSSEQSTDWQKSGDTDSDWLRTDKTFSDWLKPTGTGRLFCCCIMIWFIFMTAVVSVVFVAGKSREVSVSHFRTFSTDGYR
jgi:hypothetical protein